MLAVKVSVFSSALAALSNPGSEKVVAKVILSPSLVDMGSCAAIVGATLATGSGGRGVGEKVSGFSSALAALSNPGSEKVVAKVILSPSLVDMGSCAAIVGATLAT